jgi:LmbE family N-acetylglucosaminyl deacetylase
MKVLYIFPHPDDESFGPAGAMSRQLRDGNEVYLLTLTKGGATKQRHKLGLSVDEMGEVRHKEMLNVEKTIGLTGMNVLDLPDSGLKEMDPRDIEKVVEDEINRIKPDVVVTYAVHGISGFHDHLIIHSIVKRVYLELKEKLGYPKRLALFTITEEEAATQKHFHLSGSKPEEIDCIVEINDDDRKKAIASLGCYETYQETIKNTNIAEHVARDVSFEIYQEKFEPKLKDIFDKLN